MTRLSGPFLPKGMIHLECERLTLEPAEISWAQIHKGLGKIALHKTGPTKLRQPVLHSVLLKYNE